ncbi:MAG: nucleotidyl transferase [Rhodospirillaceae bacterium]|nr:nucleotidyl transferase [Rhodospirillaceae bacterium]|tara:strand:+ start:1821 stop:2591 length:771 start_codon:yes stop_codon:yes gene_type:complete
MNGLDIPNAVIIAAGLGSRLRPHTNSMPKCMLDFGGKTLLERQMEAYRSCGISDISVVRGYLKEKVSYPNITYFDNRDYEANNILNSLFYAETKIVGPTICGYSDILFDKEIVASLLTSPHDFSIVVDTDWRGYYEGRTEHPLEEAEKVIFDSDGVVRKIGKGIKDESKLDGEFIGMLKVSAKGANNFKHYFHKAKEMFWNKPFQKAAVFQKAYITDMIQEMVDNGVKIHCTLIKKGWKEIDTVEDYNKALQAFQE